MVGASAGGNYFTGIWVLPESLERTQTPSIWGKGVLKNDPLLDS
jgi:hypothetical protein